MDESPDEGWHPNLNFLRILVTVLTATMIGGMVVLIVLFWTRFPSGSAAPLPDAITLPEGTEAQTVTYGPGWYLVVTQAGEALVYDSTTGDLRQRVTLDLAP